MSAFSSLVSDAILMASRDKRKRRIADLRHKIAAVVPQQPNLLKAAVTSTSTNRVLWTSDAVNVVTEIADGGAPCDVLGSHHVVNPVTFDGLNLVGPDSRDFTAARLELNTMLRGKGEEFGWIFVNGVRQGFDGHGYCSIGPFFVEAVGSCLNQATSREYCIRT